MLVLSRRVDESIEIGEGVKITITKIHGNRVNVGIDAPPEAKILRSEIRHRLPNTPPSTPQSILQQDEQPDENQPRTHLD